MLSARARSYDVAFAAPPVRLLENERPRPHGGYRPRRGPVHLPSSRSIQAFPWGSWCARRQSGADAAAIRNAQPDGCCRSKRQKRSGRKTWLRTCVRGKERCCSWLTSSALPDGRSEGEPDRLGPTDARPANAGSGPGCCDDRPGAAWRHNRTATRVAVHWFLDLLVS